MARARFQWPPRISASTFALRASGGELAAELWRASNVRGIMAAKMSAATNEIVKPWLVRIKPRLPHGNLFRGGRRQWSDGALTLRRRVKHGVHAFPAPVPLHGDGNIGARRVGFQAAGNILG